MRMKRVLSLILAVVMSMTVLPFYILNVNANTAEIETSNGIDIGDCITLGNYNGEPIVWRCVAIDANGPLMLADDVLCSKEYDAAGENSTYHTDGWGYIRKNSGSNCWYDSSIRQWLNSNEATVAYTHCPPSYSDEAGFLTNFTISELSYIKTVTRLVNVNIWESKRSGYCDGGSSDRVYSVLKNSSFDAKTYYYKYIKDTIFLMSASQFNNIYNNNSGCLKASSEYWTCICYGNNYACYELVSSINADGSLHSSSNQRGACDKTIGVRPAFYLDLDNYLSNQNFIDNQSSEYSYLMGESWKNAGMENINEYLMTFPSISKAVIDSYNSNQDFIDSVAGWKFMEYMFEPAETVNDALNMKDYYKAILLSLIDLEIMDENYVETIEESSKFEYTKLLSKFIEVIKSCDEIDHEKLLSNGTCTIEEITILNDKINSLDGFSSKVSDVGKFLSTGKTINESIKLCVNYYNLCNTSKYIINVLKEVKTNTSDMFLAMAIDDIVSVTENSFDYVASGFLAGTVNATKDYGVDKINDAWESVLNSTTITKGALLGYKIGKPLSNIFLSTDSIISNYFEFTALYEVEKALKTTVEDFEKQFYNKVDADSSLNYINTVALYFKIYYLSCDYATDLVEYRNLCPFGYIFYHGKQTFEQAVSQFNATRTGLKEYEGQLFRLWTYSLKGHYPDIYEEIAPSLSDIYSTDLSTALVRLEYLSKTYTGEELKPSVTVVMGNAVLFPEEYTVSYYNNIEPGIATVKVTAAEGSMYTGAKTIEFAIKELPFVKRLSIRGTAPQTSMFALCETMEEQVENTGIELPDVYFYEGNEVVASVENGVITNDDLPIFITENGIDVLMQDKDYTAKISGSSKQIYNTEIQKLNEELSATATTNYNGLTLENEIQCNMYADSTDKIIVNGEALEPAFSTTDVADKQQYYIYSEQCVAVDSAYEEQRVYVSAIIPEGNIFVGWSVSPQVLLSSNSSVSSFIMPSEDVYISAGFMVNQSYFELKNAINEASLIEHGKYTKSSYEDLQTAIEDSRLVLKNDISEELSQERILAIRTAIDSLEEIQPLSFKGASLTLQHNLAINYKVDKALFDTVGYTEPYVLFEINGKQTMVQDYTIEDERYVFRFRNIAPNQMNDSIYATLYANYNGVEYASETREYSVAEYCYTTLEKYATDEYAKLRTLLVDLLNYGAQSQLYTNYNIENLVNANLTEAQLIWGTAEEPILTNSLDTAYEIVENPLITWKGASLNLNDSVSMKFKFTAEEVEGLTLKITSETDEWNISSEKFVSEEDVYSVKFSGLNAGQMSEKVYLTMYKDDVAVSNTVCYSIESYAYSKKDSTIEYLADLVKAMMKYGNSAHSYAN